MDLNCDMGEDPEAIANGAQESLMPSLTSINVACGGHAGNQQTMEATIQQALRWNLAVGAHPSYPDRAGLGRIQLDLPVEAIVDCVFGQVRNLAKAAIACGARVVHVKPHGALYNHAARNRTVAEAIARGVARWNRDVVLVGLAGSPMLDAFQQAGFRVAAEGFADRRYEPDGTLRSRNAENALISDPTEAGEQALRIVQQGKAIAYNGSEITVYAQTICIHGDTSGAAVIVAAVARTLRRAGVTLRALSA